MKQTSFEIRQSFRHTEDAQREKIMQETVTRHLRLHLEEPMLLPLVSNKSDRYAEQEQLCLKGGIAIDCRCRGRKIPDCAGENTVPVYP